MEDCWIYLGVWNISTHAEISEIFGGFETIKCVRFIAMVVLKAGTLESFEEFWTFKGSIVKFSRVGFFFDDPPEIEPFDADFLGY